MGPVTCPELSMSISSLALLQESFLADGIWFAFPSFHYSISEIESLAFYNQVTWLALVLCVVQTCQILIKRCGCD